MKIEQSMQLASAQHVKEARLLFPQRTKSAPAEPDLSGFSAQLLVSDKEAPFDADRVAEIKQAISEGKFSINADAIAERLIVSARELVGGSRYVS